jgi:hypothetical protein
MSRRQLAGLQGEGQSRPAAAAMGDQMGVLPEAQKCADMKRPV